MHNRFPEWDYDSGKEGGVNGPGPEGGTYKRKGMNEKAMIKCDTKDGVARVEKVMSEYIGGGGLEAIYSQTLKDDTRFASVSLIQFEQNKSKNHTYRRDSTGHLTYILSNFIPGYQNDFWKYAYEYLEKEKILKEITSQESKNTLAEKYYLIIFNYIDTLKDENKKSILKEKYKFDSDPIKYIKSILESELKEELISDLAKANISTMKRPSGVKIANPNAQKRVRDPLSKVLADVPHFKLQFAQVTAPRLLMGDYGLHNANIGVANNKLTSLDYGATFERGFSKKVDPFGIPKQIKFYKNHFLEYNDDIIKSPEMAIQFFKTGSININPVLEKLNERTDDLFKIYGFNALKKFAERMGVDIKQIDDKLNQFDNLYQVKETAAFAMLVGKQVPQSMQTKLRYNQTKIQKWTDEEKKMLILYDLMKDHLKTNLPARAMSMRQDGMDLFLKCFLKDVPATNHNMQGIKNYFKSIDGNEEVDFDLFIKNLLDYKKTQPNRPTFFSNTLEINLINNLQHAHDSKESQPTKSFVAK